jgi:hypothetical protein
VHVGRELERARIDRGESLGDVAARTSINVERLNAIERENLDELPSMTSVRGFVHAYAVAVGLDPDDTAARYTAQFDTRAALSDFESEGPAPHEPASLPAQPPPPIPSKASVALASAVSPWRRARFRDNRAPEAAAVPPGKLLNLIDDRFAPPSRASLFARNRLSPRSGAPRVEHALLVAILAVSVGFAASATLDRVRKTLWPQPIGQTASVESPAEGSTDVARVVREVTVPAERSESTTPENRGSDLNGGWTLTSRMQARDETRTQVTVGYRVRLQQRGVNVSGTGYRAMENGRIIPLRQRTPIVVEGKLDGQRLELLFTERSATGTNGGTVVMRVADESSMRGTLWSDAAGQQSRGSAFARRISK